MIRRFDEPIKAGIHYRTRPGAYGILRLGDNLLITFQARPRPEFQQNPRYIPVSTGSRYVEGRQAPFITGVGIGTPFQEESDHIHIPFPGCKVKSRMSVRVPCIEPCTDSGEIPGNLDMTHGHGEVKGGKSTRVGHIDISPGEN